MDCHCGVAASRGRYVLCLCSLRVFRTDDFLGAVRGDVREFLSPKLLGVALLFPYFLWFTGQSLADLPWPQRILSAGLRGLFVVLLAVGLARFSKTESDSHVCTVYLVDVSQSVPDEAVADARAEIKRRFAESRMTRLCVWSRSRSGRASSRSPTTPKPRQNLRVTTWEMLAQARE